METRRSQKPTATPGQDLELSIVLEWENVILSGDDRCSEMLERLGEQIRLADYRAEVIVLFDPEKVGRALITEAVDKHLVAGQPASMEIRIEECHDKTYYDLKNEGAKRARGEIVVFVDSDVIPEDGWLENLVEPFAREHVDVVAGSTYLAHDTFVEKTFALGWFFPLRPEESRFHPFRRRFFANNVAFRRDLILDHPFPDQPEGVTRGACMDLGSTLRESDIPIWTTTEARAEHPPPSGAGHFVTRALAHGRDHVFRWRRNQDRGVLTTLGSVLLGGPSVMVLSAGSILRHRDKVDLSWHQVPGAVALMCAFYVVAVLGGLTALLLPGYARKRWQI